MEHRDVAELIDEVETAWIPMSDGRRLAARLFLPKSASTQPAPVVLEYIPYRRRDGTRLGDEAMHRWFAAQGYVCARVDIAGTGDSDGLIDDEYVKREQDDGLEVIEWLARQPWSSGAVGIIGISWGGFNGLQIAARRPPALRAVISLCSTVDRFHGDAHFTGGCVNEENLEWGGCFFAMNAFPPDPAIVGEDRWREMWRHRIDNAVLAPAEWIRHQRRDEFWRHGSVIEDYAAIEVPVLSISGWADGYTAAVFQLVENLSSPVRGIIGPWGHKYPQDGVPGPAIGFLQETTRWWDHWLRGIDTGVEHDPAMRMWLQQSHTPTSHIDERRGSWIACPTWAPANEPSLSFTFAAGKLVEPGTSPPSTDSASVLSPLTTGLDGGQWCAYGQGKIAPELSVDQRYDDANSLTYDSAVLDDPVHVVGRPFVRLRVSAGRTTGFVAVRLNDVHPDGTVERLSYGVLNLCHRTSHEQPEAIEPGVAYDVVVELKGIAQTVPAGHRLRVSISTSYWPMIWPSPETTAITVYDAGSGIDLPVQTDLTHLSDDVFDAPQDARTGPVTVLRDGSETRHTIRDIGARRTESIASRDDGDYILDDIGTKLSFTRVRRSTIIDNEPLSATATIATRASYQRGDWDVRVESDIEMTSDETSFHFTARLATYDAGELFAERLFTHTIPRDHV
jgi:uncharacterized protein